MKENWIAIKKSLPLENGRYLVSLESGYVEIDFYDAIIKEWFENDYRVVAWIALTKHYEYNVK